MGRGANVCFGTRAICRLCFLSRTGPRIRLSSIPFCVPFGFVWLLVFSFLHSVFSSHLCFVLALTWKKTTNNWDHVERKKACRLARSQRAFRLVAAHGVLGTFSRWLVDPNICTNKNLLSTRGAHSLLISVFKWPACDILEDVPHNAV